LAIHITKSIDRATHKAKPTKTGITRRIPIEPALRPLLAMLHAAHEEAKGKVSPGGLDARSTKTGPSFSESTSRRPR
jgi:hypothetical protein